MTNIDGLYEQAIKPLSAADRLRLATIILRDIPPESIVDYGDAWSTEDLQDFTRSGWEQVKRASGEGDV